MSPSLPAAPFVHHHAPPLLHCKLLLFPPCCLSPSSPPCFFKPNQIRRRRNPRPRAAILSSLSSSDPLRHPPPLPASAAVPSRQPASSLRDHTCARVRVYMRVFWCTWDTSLRPLQCKLVVVGCLRMMSGTGWLDGGEGCLASSCPSCDSAQREPNAARRVTFCACMDGGEPTAGRSPILGSTPTAWGRCRFL